MSSTLDRIAGVIRETFGVDDIDVTLETMAEDVPGWDSLSHTILILSLEEAFGIELPAETRGFANLGELVATIDRLVG